MGGVGVGFLKELIPIKYYRCQLIKEPTPIENQAEPASRPACLPTLSNARTHIHHISLSLSRLSASLSRISLPLLSLSRRLPSGGGATTGGCALPSNRSGGRGRDGLLCLTRVPHWQRRWAPVGSGRLPSARSGKREAPAAVAPAGSHGRKKTPLHQIRREGGDAAGSHGRRRASHVQRWWALVGGVGLPTGSVNFRDFVVVFVFGL